MLGLDRSTGKKLEESDVPSHVHAQIEGDGLVQTLISRGKPSRDSGRGCPIDSDLRERQVDSLGPRPQRGSSLPSGCRSSRNRHRGMAASTIKRRLAVVSV
jgi:hypothetical protein